MAQTPIIPVLLQQQLYQFSSLTLEQQQTVIGHLECLCREYPYHRSPHIQQSNVEHLWCGLVTTKRKLHQPLTAEQQTWWASRQEVLHATSPTTQTISLIGLQYWITRQRDLRDRLESWSTNRWNSPMIREASQVMLKHLPQ